MTSMDTLLQERSSTVQRPRRALLYGLGIWFIWVTLVIFSFELLPAEIGASAFFVSMKVVSLAAIVLVFAVSYLRKVTESSFMEGLLVGLSWTAILIALDIVHSFIMVPMDMSDYFFNVVSSYLVVPVTTTLVMGYLKRKT